MAEGLSRYSQEQWDQMMAGIDARKYASDATQYGQAYADSSKEFFGF